VRHRLGSRRIPGLAGAVLTLVLLAGCGGPTAAPAGAVDGAASAPAAVAPAESRPTRLLVPSIGVDTGVIDLGLRPDRTMEVPADGSTAGWYVHSPTPGELGPAVLAAHVDWQGEDGVFVDLHEAEVGDAVTVERADGRTAEFVVRRVEQYAKEEFPTQEVYADVDTAQLRLITCGGEFDTVAGSYLDNVVVYAELVA